MLQNECSMYLPCCLLPYIHEHSSVPFYTTTGNSCRSQESCAMGQYVNTLSCMTNNVHCGLMYLTFCHIFRWKCVVYYHIWEFLKQILKSVPQKTSSIFVNDHIRCQVQQKISNTNNIKNHISFYICAAWWWCQSGS